MDESFGEVDPTPYTLTFWYYREVLQFQAHTHESWQPGVHIAAYDVMILQVETADDERRNVERH